MAGLYIHIPFCKQACHYCDFHFSTNQSYRFELCKALAEEIKLRHDYVGTTHLDSLYFGGGTPSILTGNELGLVLEMVHRHFSLAPEAEVTLEANPDDLDESKLKELRSMGINRLSIGIQSFDDDVLRYLNRAHSATDAEACMTQARAHGFNNISIDLMFALPGQTEDQWLRNLQRALQFHPEHLSAYSLTIEEKTAFGKWARSGRLQPAAEEAAARQFELLMDVTAQSGYEQYEISNFSLPGMHARHNSSYWLGVPYLGIGPGAHSFDGRRRHVTLPNNHLYMKALAQGENPVTEEVLTTENRINEYMLTTLRTKWGMQLTRLRELSGASYPELVNTLRQLSAQGLVEAREDVVTLTRKGRLVADRIAEELFLV